MTRRPLRFQISNLYWIGAPCAALVAATLIAVLLLCPTAARPVRAQGPPLIPTVPGGSPLGEPRPAATNESPVAPDAGANVEQPEAATATPVATAVPVETRERDGATVRGALTTTTRTAGGLTLVQRREYEILTAHVEGLAAASGDRHLRLVALEDGEPVWDISTVESGDASVTVVDHDQWTIGPRQPPAPLARALQPVLDMAELAYATCTGGDGAREGAPADSLRDLRSDDVCVFTDADGVAALLASYGEGLSVTSSLLAVRLDREAGEAERYLLTAEVVKDDGGTEPVVFAIEWTYERADSLAGQATASGQQTGAIPGVARAGDLSSPIIDLGALPAPERTINIAQVDGVLHLELARTVEQARGELLTALLRNGWLVMDEEAALIAKRRGESVVVWFAEGVPAGTAVVDVVRVK